MIASGVIKEIAMKAYYDTHIADFRIRTALEQDTGLILQFIKELAEYEQLLNEVVATEEILRESLFIKKQAKVILAEYKGEPVGFALFFHNFSTFLGTANVYLEDLFIRESHRGLGLGQAMFACLAKITLESGGGRLDWWCLDWNEPSIAFYKRMGAKAMDEWTVYRVDGEALSDLARRL